MSAFAPAAQEKRLHPDAMALRDYILAGDKTRYDLLPQGVVMIGVTHSNLTMAMPDIRLDLHTTVSRSYIWVGEYHRALMFNCPSLLGW